MYFLILRQAIQQLLEGDLGDATEIILGGCSAGAVAAVVLGDQIAQMVREVAGPRRGAFGEDGHHTGEKKAVLGPGHSLT